MSARLALVTGAAGFIGSHVTRALVHDGWRVRALHRPGDDLRNLADLAPGDVERVAGDVTDAAGVRRAMRGVERVFHLAAIYALWTRDPARMRAVNVDGTRVVLEAARAEGVARVVHTSSIARFGGQGRGRRATEASPFALGPTGDVYAQSKADAHALAQTYTNDVDLVTVAPCGPIGPGDVGPTPTGRLLLLAARLPLLTVTPTQTNFAHVADMARGHLLAADRGRRGETYLLGHRDLSFAELGRIAHAVLGMRRPIVEVPFTLARGAAHVAVALAERTGRPPLVTPASIAIAELGLAADCGRAVRELGLPQTPIEVAVADAFAWFAREGYLPARRGRPARRLADTRAWAR